VQNATRIENEKAHAVNYAPGTEDFDTSILRHLHVLDRNSGLCLLKSHLTYKYLRRKYIYIRENHFQQT
jgi:hypothetical protein